MGVDNNTNLAITFNSKDDDDCSLNCCELLDMAKDYTLSKRFGIACMLINYKQITKYYIDALANECFVPVLNDKEILPPLPEWAITYVDHVCQKIEEAEVVDYSFIYADHVCEKYIEDVFEIKIDYINHVCEKITIVEDIDLTFEYVNHVCEKNLVDILGYSIEYIDHICEVRTYEPTWQINYTGHVCEKEEFIPASDKTILDFTVNNINTAHNSYFLMKFNPIGGKYGVKPDDNMDEIWQTQNMIDNNFMEYRYSIESDTLYVNYAQQGLHNVKIKYDDLGTANTLQSARNCCKSMAINNLRVVNELDLSLFNELSSFNLENASVDNIIFPQKFNNITGMGMFALVSIENLSEIDLSHIVIPTIINQKVNTMYYIAFCSDVVTIKLPNGGNANIQIVNGNSLTTIDFTNVVPLSMKFELTDNHNLSSLQNFKGHNNPISMFKIDGCPYLPYNDYVEYFPNLTSVNGTSNLVPALYSFENNNYSAAVVNKILAQLDKVSVSGYNYRRISLIGNAVPDSTSGGINGLTAKANLIKKGISVITNN